MKQILIVFIVLLFISCENNQSKPQEKTKADTQHQTTEKTLYSAYTPSKLKLKDVLFVAIDAHGDAQLALKHLRWSAENYGFHLIALNNVENKDSKFEQHINQGVQQAKQQLNIQAKQVFYVGFSGGARMALMYAQRHQTAGLIMLGAGPGQQSVSFNFPLAMITGTRDFNFVEQYYPISSPQVDNPNLITLHWQGKHEWPDSSTIDEAVSFVLFTAGTIVESDIRRKAQLEKAKQAQKSNNLFFYFKELELISKTSTGEMQSKTRQSLQSMRNSTKVNQYFKHFNEILTAEQKRNQIYIKDLDEKPLDWWKATLIKLDDLANNQSGLEADSYARTKAFLGILLYSKTSAAVSGRGNAKLLPKYLEVYRMLEPENPDLYFFEAVYKYALGDNDATIESLKKALQFGFKDDTKLHQSFPQMIISAAQKAQ